jgi:hypothetical protein
LHFSGDEDWGHGCKFTNQQQCKNRMTLFFALVKFNLGTAAKILHAAFNPNPS